MGSIIEAVKQYAIGTAIPWLTGTVMTWLLGSKVLAVLGLNPTSVAKVISGGLVFAVTFGFSWLTAHKILLGHYSPGAKASVGHYKLPPENAGQTVTTHRAQSSK